MAKRRLYGKLPANVYERNGWFYYRRGRKSYLLGTDRRAAIAEAAEANLELGCCPPAEQHAVTEMLLSESSVAERATPVIEACGIYFLLHEGRVVYVGQSISCHRRIAQHESEGGKIFDAYYVLTCDATELDRREALYIAKFRPAYNSRRGPVRGWTEAKQEHAERFTKPAAQLPGFTKLPVCD